MRLKRADGLGAVAGCVQREGPLSRSLFRLFRAKRIDGIGHRDIFLLQKAERRQAR